MPKAKKALVLHDCRAYSTLSFSPHEDPQTASVYAHEGSKPDVGDYLALKAPDDQAALYRVTYVDRCYNVDPANMWIARVEFVPGAAARKLFPPLPALV